MKWRSPQVIRGWLRSLRSKWQGLRSCLKYERSLLRYSLWKSIRVRIPRWPLVWRTALDKQWQEHEKLWRARENNLNAKIAAQDKMIADVIAPLIEIRYTRNDRSRSWNVMVSIDERLMQSYLGGDEQRYVAQIAGQMVERDIATTNFLKSARESERDLYNKMARDRKLSWRDGPVGPERGKL